MTEPKIIHLVCAETQDSSRILYASMNRDRVQDYINDIKTQQAMNPDPTDEAMSIIEFPLDAPREASMGAWDVEVSPPTAEVVYIEFETWTTPQRPPQTQVIDTPEGKERTHSYRAWGATREEAIERARAYRTAEMAKA